MMDLFSQKTLVFRTEKDKPIVVVEVRGTLRSPVVKNGNPCEHDISK